MTFDPDAVLPDTPACRKFFDLHQLPPPKPRQGLNAYWNALGWEQQELGGWTRPGLAEALASHLAAEQPETPLFRGPVSLEILPGHDKDGRPETRGLRLQPGDVVSIVGPTGSGKSRLLADIECLAQGDTPSGRRILVDGCPPDDDARYTSEGSLVAQITQNMNFVMDLPVGAFLALHAESRGLPASDVLIGAVLDAALGMAGEPFTQHTPLTQLSGGQSRALMIADAAILSPKPVVLIDEIENAGVDRLGAMQLFVGQNKIVLLSTHDPLLALSGRRRLVIRNGAIAAVISTTPAEASLAQELARTDARLSALRTQLRGGYVWHSSTASA